jgi:hypothetical protein
LIVLYRFLHQLNRISQAVSKETALRHADLCPLPRASSDWPKCKTLALQVDSPAASGTPTLHGDAAQDLKDLSQRAADQIL